MKDFLCFPHFRTREIPKIDFKTQQINKKHREKEKKPLFAFFVNQNDPETLNSFFRFLFSLSERGACSK